MTQDPMGVGFGANATHCGLGAFGHGTGFCKDGCGSRVILGGFSGYCAPCAASHHIEPIKLGPDAETGPRLLVDTKLPVGSGLPVLPRRRY